MVKNQRSKHIDRICALCGCTFQAWLCRVKRGGGKFCSQKCALNSRGAQEKRVQSATTIRQLRAGDVIPSGEPKRYRAAHGYIRLRWHVSPYECVEAYEHRVIAGMDAEHVHHINGVRDDNRPENLRAVTTLEHGAEHARWDIDEACEMYRRGGSLVDIQRHYHIGTAAAMRALKLRGVRMRTLQEAWQLRKAKKDTCHMADHSMRFA